ncbi:hypothetical protein [Shewanella sp. Koi 1]
MNNKVKGIPFAEVKAAALANPTVLEAYLLEQAAVSNRVDVEIFITKLMTALSDLPKKDIEVGDLANEIGIAMASLAGSEKHIERECLSGIKHGFSMVRDA